MSPVPGLTVELVRPDGPASLEEWFSPLEAVDHADWPDGPIWFLHERAALLEQPGVQRHVLGVARLPHATAGCFQVRMHLLENLDAADLEIYVDPAWQHRGIGRDLLEVAERVARERGRTLLTGSTEVPLGSPAGERRDRFARAAGFEPALAEARFVLRLPVDPAVLDALECEVLDAGRGYRLVTWRGACPLEWRAGRIRAARGMSTDVPSGDLEVEPEHWDAARLAVFERVVEAMDRATISAAAIAPDGSLAAFSELAVPRVAPLVAYQLDTIVMPAHRGRRLGLRVKVANLRSLQEAFPTARRVITTNATSNAPMIRVNERLGFRLEGSGSVWQKRLT